MTHNLENSPTGKPEEANIQTGSTLQAQTLSDCLSARLFAQGWLGTSLCFQNTGGGYRFYISNNLLMTEEEMVRLYSQRFWIETFHQEIKQHLGFREVFMRSWIGVQTHWTLVAIAYNLIGVGCRHSSGSFRQKIFSFRESIIPRALFILSKKSLARR